MGNDTERLKKNKMIKEERESFIHHESGTQCSIHNFENIKDM